jgi:hypothetical protein
MKFGFRSETLKSSFFVFELSKSSFLHMDFVIKKKKKKFRDENNSLTLKVYTMYRYRSKSFFHCKHKFESQADPSLKRVKLLLEAPNKLKKKKKNTSL